jgi:hypothetical protein
MTFTVDGTNGLTFPDSSTQDSAAAPAGSTGQVQYNNAGAFGAISSGTSGQVLTSAGAGSAPAWADAAGGAWTFIANQAITTGTSTYDFTGLGDYDVIRVLVMNRGASNGSAAYVYCGLSTGTAAQNPRDDNYGTILSYYESGQSYSRPSGNTADYISGYASADANKPYYLETTIMNFGQSAYTTFSFSAMHAQSTYYGSNGSGYILYQEPYDYIRVSVQQATTGGNIIVLGAKQ